MLRMRKTSSPIFQCLAITTGNEGIVKLLLDLRAKLVDEQDVNGNTGLHIACAFGFTSLAGLLFEQGADFGARNNKDKTPLGMATVSGQWEIWKIKHIDEIRKSSGEDRPASSTKHFSNDLSEALLLASRKSQWDIVKQLLQYGVDPSTSDRAGWTPMHFAAGSGQREIIEMLLKIGFNINEKTSDLTISRDYSQWGSVRLLLENGADHAMSNYDAGTLLHYLAANNGDLDQLQRGFNLNETNGGMPHPIACLWPTWLFEHGADPTLSHESDWTILHYAARGGEIDLVKVLFERGLKVNEKTTSGDTMLTIACKFENWHIAKWLLDHGVNPTPSNEIGWTAIHFAARGGELEIIERLLIRGIKIYEKTNNSETPITIACEKSKWHIVKWLLDHNADPTLYDKDGWTLMHFAARARQLHIVKILIERGFSVNEKAKDGETPLSIVRRQGWTDMIEVMLEYGSDESRSY